MIALLFGLLLGPMQIERVQLEVVWDGQDCGAAMNGERFSLTDLEAPAERWGREGRAASVVWERDVPYRCIGGAIYQLQLAGIRDVTFDLPGDLVSITVPPGRCRIALNGRPIALARLRKEAKVWVETQPEVRFQPSPQAEYRCVDRVLRVLRDARVSKVALLVNEEAAEGAR